MNLKIFSANKHLPRIFDEERKNLLKFAANEFKELSKKNLKLPIRLYQL